MKNLNIDIKNSNIDMREILEKGEEIQNGKSIKLENGLTMRKLMLLYLKNNISIDIPISIMGTDVSYIFYENGNIILDEVDLSEEEK